MNEVSPWTAVLRGLGMSTARGWVSGGPERARERRPMESAFSVLTSAMSSENVPNILTFTKVCEHRTLLSWIQYPTRPQEPKRDGRVHI